MQALNGRLVLSPSDLNDYVECPHLTTLALEVARGTRKRPFVPNEHGDLLRRKGEEHEAAYLTSVRAAGNIFAFGTSCWRRANRGCTAAMRPSCNAALPWRPANSRRYRCG